MERLTGSDASFLYMENPSMHMHTLKIAVIDLPEHISPHQAQEMLAGVIERRLHRVPRLRLRPIDVPMGLHHPVWVRDPKFDVSRHLYRAAIPGPGGQREMDDTIALIASQPLHRDRPLWEVWTLEGLADGGIVYLVKIHHAIADGQAALGMLNSMMDEEPIDEDFDAAVPEWTAEEIPSTSRLVLDAFRDQRQQAGLILPLIRRTMAGHRSVRRYRKAREVSLPGAFHTKRATFNRKLSPLRAFATVSLPLEDLKLVKNAAGVTLNDVFLAIIAGGVNVYLDGIGENRSFPLLAHVPMALADSAGDRIAGNRVTSMVVSLCSDVKDPLERLRAIHEVTDEAKEIQNQLGVETMLDWNEATPAALYRWVYSSYSKLNLANRLPPMANLIASNVRGPSQPRYIVGARLRSIYSVGPLAEGVGLNVTAWSYSGEIGFSVLADPDSVPDPHIITEAFPKVLRELADALKANDPTCS